MDKNIPKLLIEDIHTSANPYPPAIHFDSMDKKVKFFLGDRWLEIGEWSTRTVIENKGNPDARMYIQMEMPDMEKFFAKQYALNNGSQDWALWGVRVN